ncbi:MAG: choice-of-anchor B family protein [Bacteroidia bacterium]
MKKLFVFFLFLIITEISFAQGFGSYKIDFLGNWNNPELPKSSIGQIWNDLTGYYDSLTGKEYVIIGSTDSIYFFDVTDPKNIKLCDVEFGNNRGVINRDFECLSHYVYCVSDNAPAGSLQVFDLRYLPDSVHKVYDSDSLGVNTHSIFINRQSKRLYMCANTLKRGGRAAIDVLSLENPEVPRWIGRLNIPQTADGTPLFKTIHEIYQRNDTIYASAEWYGLWIFDMTDLNNQKLLGVIRNYPFNGYNHNGWLSPNGKYFCFTDEVPQGLPLKIFDISDMANSKLVTMFHNGNATKSTPHNPFWIGNNIHVSYYHDGYVIFNADNIDSIYPSAWFYTSPVPPQTYEGFRGNWGLYPYFPSGNIALSDMQFGLYMVKPHQSVILSNRVKVSEQIQINIYPNPSTLGFIDVLCVEPSDYRIIDQNGKFLLKGTTHHQNQRIDISMLQNGIYYINIATQKSSVTKKIIKQ